MTFMLIKLFLSKAYEWIVAHWQLSLFIAISLVAFYYKTRYGSIVKELEAYKQAQVVAVAKQTQDNKVKFDIAVIEQAKSDTIAAQQIKDLNIDKTTLTNAIKGYYETRSIKSNMGAGTNSLLPKTNSNSEYSAETASSQQGLASSGEVTNSACIGLSDKLKTLEQAVALETILYNQAKARIDLDCNLVGCE